MPVSVVVGGQFGSEGKGKVAQFITRTSSASAVVRVGGPNSGHSAVANDGRLITLRQLPAGCIGTDAIVILPAGSLIDVQLLRNEIDALGMTPARLRVDAKASLVTAAHRQTEVSDGLVEEIGSTGSGTGAALRERMSRVTTHMRAKDEAALAPFIEENTASLLRALLDNNERVVVEGTQGFGLSLWHATDYPFATSRDTTAAAFVAEAGLAPHDVDDVALVIRSFPIRVGGHSGPLPNEIEWPTLAKEAQLPNDFHELTSATRRVRRVARFDPVVVRDAITCNRPHRVFLNHMDYIDPRWKQTGKLSREASDFLIRIEAEIGREIDYFGFGPDITESRNRLLRKAAA